jgi:glutamate/aspartate transport system permease protein
MNLDFSFITGDLLVNYIWGGLKYSVLLTLVAMAGGIVLGTLLAMMRLSGIQALEWPASLYVNTIRSIPLVMVILWFFLLVPFIIGRPIGAENSAYFTFIIFEAAYFAEIMRAGIQSVPKGQTYAGYAIGLNYGQTTLMSGQNPNKINCLASGAGSVL